MRRARISRQAAAAAVVVVALAAGCGDDETAATTTTAPSTPTTVAESTTSTTVDVEAEVLAAYGSAWDAFVTAATSEPVEPGHPGLSETMSGPALSGVNETLRGLFERQERYRALEYGLDPEIVELTEQRAVIHDCVRDVGTLISTVDGAVLDEFDLESSVIVIMEKEDGGWRRTSVQTEGATACDD